MPSAIFLAIVSFSKKFKILHILYWSWSFLSLLHLLRERQPGNTLYLYDALIVTFFQMVSVYGLVYGLMPRLLARKKYVQFVLSALALMLLSAVFSVLIQDLITVIFKHRHLSYPAYYIMFVSHLTDIFIITCIFFAIYTVLDRYENEKLAHNIEKEKLQNELNFLKAQLNPHFLFNAINSIYVLIEEDKKLAADTLLKFSGLLRYQLYDCSNNWTPLEKELDFLKDYVDLEKMRNNENLTVSFEYPAILNGYEIAPYILTPFVENAFKHKSNSRGGDFVIIRAEVKNKVLYFTVENSYADNDLKTETLKGGIGLQNIHRRLELLYPGKHQINVIKDSRTYKTNLEVQLHENAMYTG